jgi:amino acid permease
MHRDMWQAPVQEPRVTLKRIAAPAQIVMLTVDLVVAYCGYFTYGANVQSNILDGNYPSTTAATVGRVAISLAVACSIPLQLFPARICWVNVARQLLRLLNVAWQLLRRLTCERRLPPVTVVAAGAQSAQSRDARGSESSGSFRAPLLPASEHLEAPSAPPAASDMSYGPMYFAVSLLLFTVVYIIAFFVDSLGLVFELVGATASTSMAYILPGLYTLRLFSDHPRMRTLGAVYVAVGVVIAGLSLTGVAKKLVFPED